LGRVRQVRFDDKQPDRYRQYYCHQAPKDHSCSGKLAVTFWHSATSDPAGKKPQGSPMWTLQRQARAENRRRGDQRSRHGEPQSKRETAPPFYRRMPVFSRAYEWGRRAQPVLSWPWLRFEHGR
jgi:hypothetical protein